MSEEPDPGQQACADAGFSLINCCDNTNGIYSGCAAVKAAEDAVVTNG